MREASRRQTRAERRALAISVLWMLAVQVACVALWDQGVLARQSSLVHWLVVGVLPPALALWTMRAPAAQVTPRRW